MPLPPITRPMFGALRIASSGLSAQRTRMEVIAQNLANVETTRTAQGGPYQRQIVQLEAQGNAPMPASAALAMQIDPNGVTPPTVPTLPGMGDASTAISAGQDSGDALGGVFVKMIGTDATEGPLVYNPGHPDADKNGYVRMPNVNMTDEMMDLMNARRIYEANATVFSVAKAMLNRAIDI